MSQIRERVFKTSDEAKAVCGEKESVFHVVDSAVADRDVYVAARTHPLARAAAALHWGISCSTSSEKDIKDQVGVLDQDELVELEALIKARKKELKEQAKTEGEQS
jgi:hypothetical protein